MRMAVLILKQGCDQANSVSKAILDTLRELSFNKMFSKKKKIQQFIKLPRCHIATQQSSYNSSLIVKYFKQNPIFVTQATKLDAAIIESYRESHCLYLPWLRRCLGTWNHRKRLTVKLSLKVDFLEILSHRRKVIFQVLKGGHYTT